MSELSFIPNASKAGVYPNQSDEQTLMARIADGEEAAIQELLCVYGEMLARLVGRLTAWHADSDDVLQEVLLVVWRKAGGYRGDGSLDGWLKRIAVNRCRNYFRSINAIRRKIERFADSLGNDHFTDKSVYGTQLESVEESSELQKAMAELPGADRSVLVLFYLEEMSGDEVALSLGIKAETLHVRLHRARKKLKKIMEQD